MRKPDTLRAAIVAQLPELASEPDRLRMWIERGGARSVMTAELGFGFAYRLNVLVTELAGDVALLGLAIFQWLRVNQPELMTPGRDGFTFDVDILDNRTADVLIQLDLTEDVAVTQRDDGGFDMQYLAEQDPLFDDELGLGETDPVPPLAGIDIAD